MYPIVMTYNYEFSCKNCTDRYPGCHGNCKNYKEEGAAYDEKKAEFNRQRDARRYTSNSIAASIDAEAKQRKNNRGYKNFRR